MSDTNDGRLSAHGLFPTTCWSRILPGDEGSRSEEAEALEILARRYWRPIHVFVRGALSRSDDEARDLAQDFFVWMLETGFVRKADPARGRFRAFLKTALRHYVLDQDRKRAAAKRGGGRRFVPLESGDDGPLPLAAKDGTPEDLLDDAWRAEVVSLALERTEQELERTDRAVVFAVFRDYFLEAEAIDYRAVADRHGVTTTDVSNYLQRAKRLYRSHLRDLVADTVSTEGDLADELAWLLGGARR